ncbi:MAG: deoxyribose-phosphate aldolase [Bacilli bacterium]|jgi:deoxyribose-phosphate aldolase
MKLNKYIDHTNLKADATKNDIKVLCEEALQYDFASVCVHPFYVKYARSILSDSDVAIGTVIGFPIGQNTTAVKAFEAVDAISNGADELDMVINIGALKDRDYGYIKHEIQSLVKVSKGHILKIIIETSYLDEEEKIAMVKICNDCLVQYIKTSTGFSKSGASQDDIKLMRKYANKTLAIKASGGVKTYQDAITMIEAGATRIGTSNGVKIMEEVK